MTVEELRAARFETSLEFERRLDSGPSFRAHLVSYQHSGLKLYALVAVPRSAPLAQGYPLLVANHGYVPSPKKYGITSDGRDSRPGDYYRSIPELYTARGFMVVMPDYRGHNSSDGYEYIDPQGAESPAYYAEDVVALISGLGDIENADLDRVFMWSHSMGGRVAIRVLLATDVVKASSFWSTENVVEFKPNIVGTVGALQIHHSFGDPTTSYQNSVSLTHALQGVDPAPVLHTYIGNDHFFSEKDRELAADRDASFFMLH